MSFKREAIGDDTVSSATKGSLLQREPLSAADALALAGLILTVLAAAILVVGLPKRETGFCYDSTVYLAGAKSIAEGSGYRYSFYLGAPPIGFYPPLQSAWLSLFWRMAPSFPSNIGWLNLGEAILGIAALSSVFLFLRRSGLPLWAAFLISLPPAVAHTALWFQSDLFSEFAFMLLLYLVGNLWAGASEGSPRRWLATGILLSMAYGFRTAAMPSLPVSILFAGWKPGPDRWKRMGACALPILAAALAWKMSPGSGDSYGNIAKEYFKNDLGGMAGVKRQFLSEAVECAQGRPFWEVYAPALVRLPEVLEHKLGRAGLWLGIIGAAIPFWILAAGIVRGILLTRRRAEFAIRFAVAGYLAQVMMWPYPPVIIVIGRYIFPIIPLAAVWAWRGLGMDKLDPNAKARSWVAAVALVLAATSNLYLSAGYHRVAGNRNHIHELAEVAGWLGKNAPKESRVSIGFDLPVAHLAAYLERPVAVDYLYPVNHLSPLPHKAQHFLRADYVVVREWGPKTNAPNGLFAEMMSSSGGFYRLLKIDPNIEASWRRENHIPAPESGWE